MERRDCLRALIAAFFAPTFFRCATKDPMSPSPEFDVGLTGSTEQFARTIRAQFGEIKRLAINPGEEISYGLKEDVGGWQVCHLSMTDEDPESQGNIYLHPRLRSGEDVVHVLLGWKLLSPTIKLVRSGGEVIFERNIPNKYSSKPLLLDFNKLFQIGLGIAAVAFAMWLGAKIVGAVVAAVAFIAFNALLIGIVLSAIGIVDPAIRWLLEKFGITEKEVKSWFDAGVEDLYAFIQHLAGVVEGVYSN